MECMHYQLMEGKIVYADLFRSLVAGDLDSSAVFRHTACAASLPAFGEDPGSTGGNPAIPFACG